VTRYQYYRNRKKQNPGLCPCGQPATSVVDGSVGVCGACRKKRSGLVVSRNQRVWKPLKSKVHRNLSEKLVDEFETGGRGWGSLDQLEKQLAEIELQAKKRN
jgi:hypothetical protein